ncbi:bifunctional hydroxymethylpyrimidine kinase/phosphomethylpyrimidine kinase [Nitratireductor sp. GCM10026969]|uniref:bifunctional hydroxymethylpyrimidine kinase/phosphomethylpyrimidine kinase n=1 Tax=Nitratireductor sp. GCM10026969 TaxID=3252645 RepID=UPI00360A6DF0
MRHEEADHRFDPVATRLLDRVDARDINAILTGYIASADTATAAAAFIDRCGNSVVVMCDPAMGDIDYGLYVEEHTADALARELVPQADILTPNLFEAASCRCENG